jgi:DNA-binding Xre family transcriptional regulator
MKTKGERLQQIMSEYQLSNVDVANITGLSKAFISDIKLGKKGVSDEVIATICKKLPSLNPEWFKFGEGAMYLKNDTQNKTPIAAEPAEKAGYNPIHTTQDDGGDYPKIVTNAKTAFIKYYQQMNLISQLMQSKQEEYQEVYEALTK